MKDFFDLTEDLKNTLIKDFSIEMNVLNKKFINDFFELNQSIKKFINGNFTFSTGSNKLEYVINDFAGFLFHPEYNHHRNYNLAIKKNTFAIKSHSIPSMDFILGSYDFPTQYIMKQLEDVNIKKFVKENFRLISKKHRKKFESSLEFLNVVKEVLSIAVKNGLEMKDIINLHITYNKKELVIIVEEVRNLLLITKDIDIGKITNYSTLKLN